MKKYTMESSVGIFVLIGLSCVGYLTVQLGHVPLFEGETYRLNARFTSVAGLKVGSPVHMYGINIGRVERLVMDQKDQEAEVEMNIQKGIRIYEDAIASIKTEGLIGDKYVSIQQGGSGEQLKPGDRIIQTQPAVDLADIIGKYAFGDVKKEEPASK